jgi:hypothetical protein
MIIWLYYIFDRDYHVFINLIHLRFLFTRVIPTQVLSEIFFGNLCIPKIETIERKKKTLSDEELVEDQKVSNSIVKDENLEDIR